MVKEIVTKDVTKIKSSYKSLGWIVGAVVVGFIVFFALNALLVKTGLLTTEVVIAISFIIALPISLPGFVSPFGIPLEKYLLKYYEDKFKYPSKLVYKRKLTKRELAYQTKFSANVPEKQISNAIKLDKSYRSFK